MATKRKTAAKKPAAKKPKAPTIPLNQILAALDSKDRNFYNNLDDELKKKFSPFMLLKYAASVTGIPELEEYYIKSTNTHANPSMLSLGVLDENGNRHQQLQWLLFTTISPGMGAQNHKWLPMKQKPNGAIRNQLAPLFPQMKDDDLDVLASLTTKQELDQYIKDHGEK